MLYNDDEQEYLDHELAKKLKDDADEAEHDAQLGYQAQFGELCKEQVYAQDDCLIANVPKLIAFLEIETQTFWNILQRSNFIISPLSIFDQKKLRYCFIGDSQPNLPEEFYKDWIRLERRNYKGKQLLRFFIQTLIPNP
jgi:hypothetical protein